jgi:hypothetical protein
VILEFELRASQLLGRRSITWAIPPVLKAVTDHFDSFSYYDNSVSKLKPTSKLNIINSLLVRKD